VDITLATRRRRCWRWRGTLSWLRTEEHCSLYLHIGDGKRCTARTTTSSARAIIWNPPGPLCGRDSCTCALHVLHNLVLLGTAQATVIVNADNIAIVILGDTTIRRKFCPHVKVAVANVCLAIATRLVTSTSRVTPYMPSCLRQAFAIVLGDVQFHTDRAVIGLNVTVT
jgi:hypothetical protein